MRDVLARQPPLTSIAVLIVSRAMLSLRIVIKLRLAIATIISAESILTNAQTTGATRGKLSSCVECLEICDEVLADYENT